MKLYVLVLEELGASYGAVQGGHALAQWMLDNPNHHWNNHTLVYLRIPDTQLWMEKLTMEGINFSHFKEPDIGNKITAIASYGDGRIFRKLKLL